MELKENEAIIDNKRNERENIEDEEKDKEYNTFKKIKEIQQLIKKNLKWLIIVCKLNYLIDVYFIFSRENKR
jgi:hypothetical protein